MVKFRAGDIVNYFFYVCPHLEKRQGVVLGGSDIPGSQVYVVLDYETGKLRGVWSGNLRKIKC